MYARGVLVPAEAHLSVLEKGQKREFCLSKIVSIVRYEGKKEVKVTTPHASAVGLCQYIMNNN